MNDIQENQVHAQLVINIIVLTLSFHHFFPDILISKASLTLPFTCFLNDSWPVDIPMGSMSLDSFLIGDSLDTLF